MSETHLVCSGCDTTFTLRGYQNHLSQTKDPLCRAVYDKLKKSYETFPLPEQSGNSSDHDEAMEDDINMEEDSVPVGPENLNLEEVLHEDEPLVDDSDLEDTGGVDADWETGWEQPRGGAPQEHARASGDEPADTHSDTDTPRASHDEEKSDSGDEPPQRKPERFIIGDGYGVKPAVRLLYTDKYPSSRAGKPLSHEESRDGVYGTSFGGGDNLWAPFHSKKDWEIARWAKLRGVGSTAFSEMLAIDGVGFFFHNLPSIFFFFNSRFKGLR